MSLKGRRFLTQDEPEGWCACLGLIISMQDGEKLSLERIQAFMEASEEVHFEGKRRQEVYDWITLLLRRQDYRRQGKGVRGLLRSYVAKMTGRSRAQVTRLIGRYLVPVSYTHLTLPTNREV